MLVSFCASSFPGGCSGHLQMLDIASLSALHNVKVFLDVAEAQHHAGVHAGDAWSVEPCR